MEESLIAVALVTLYILPSIIAFCREHHSTISIFLVNLLTAWTLLGWILALVWACTETISRATSRGAITKAPPSPPSFSPAIAAIFVIVGSVAVLSAALHQLGSRLFATSPSATPSSWCRHELKKPPLKRAEKAAALCTELGAALVAK